MVKRRRDLAQRRLHGRGSRQALRYRGRRTGSNRQSFRLSQRSLGASGGATTRAFLKALEVSGFAAGRNIASEYRFAETDHQSRDSEAARHHHSASCPSSRRRGDRMSSFVPNFLADAQDRCWHQRHCADWLISCPESRTLDTN